MTASASGERPADRAQAVPREADAHLEADDQERGALHERRHLGSPGRGRRGRAPAATSIGPSSAEHRQPDQPAEHEPDESADPPRTAGRSASPARRQRRRSGPLRGAVERRRDGAGHEDHDQQHAQVLEHGDHPLVGAQFAGHDDDSGGAPGDHRERPGHPADPPLQTERLPGGEAQREGAQRDEQDREPVRGDGEQRLEAPRGAQRDPDDRLRRGRGAAGRAKRAGTASDRTRPASRPPNRAGEGGPTSPNRSPAPIAAAMTAHRWITVVRAPCRSLCRPGWSTLDRGTVRAFRPRGLMAPEQSRSGSPPPASPRRADELRLPPTRCIRWACDCGTDAWSWSVAARWHIVGWPDSWRPAPR